jgi:peptidyl-tRNA hydrolase
MFNILHTLAAGMRVNGLQGISDTMRAMTISDLPGLTALRNSVDTDHYGHLFDAPMRIAQTLRFQLNPMFEARKLTKGEMLAGEYEGLAPSLRPYKAMQAEDPMGRLVNVGGPALPRDVLPTGYDIQPGGKLIDRYSQIFTRTQGQDVAAINDVDKAFKDSGVLGYNLQHHGIYDVGRIWDKQFSASLAAGKSAEDATTIADTYAQAHGPKMYTFGAQSPIGRSANFLFFPFSFESKAASAAAEYLTAEPVRLFLTHELARRAGLVDTKLTPGQKSKLGQLVDRYAPVMNDVQKLNPWKYGIGPGEFLGLYRPIAEALALPVENVANVLHPGVIPADKVTTFKQLVPRLLSGYKAIGTFWNDVNSQMHVFTSPKHESTKTEINDYYTNKDGLDALYAQQGLPFGTDGSIAGFRQSQKVPVQFRQQYITDLTKLQALYPAGPQHAAMISNHAQIQSNQIDSILQKVTKTTPEKGITTLEATRLQLNQIYTLSQQAPVMKHIVHDLETTQMRNAAVRLFEGMSRSDQVAFNSLWRSLGYETQYGPLAVPVVTTREPGTS